MATWLDKQIEELEIIVVKCMKLEQAEPGWTPPNCTDGA